MLTPTSASEHPREKTALRFVSRLLATALFALVTPFLLTAEASTPAKVGIWMKHEASLISSTDYENPLYDVRSLVVHFRSPSGRQKRINGFWDGGRDWKVRFAPDELGVWTWETECSNPSDSGLHGVRGSFECVANQSSLPLYQHGSIIRPKGFYYLLHSDGTPFFWAACTAWNGALKSTEEEWDTYLRHRARSGYSVIQFVTTQWRGGSADSAGEVAFQGAGKIRINPGFFRRLDRKVDRINEEGLVAAPILLWALQQGAGRHLSPGYYLPDPEAILLARYLVARYGGNQVVWILGGDGLYAREYEQRWKNIGRGVFGDEHPGVVTTHSQGRSWIGNEYAHEEWLDGLGYQTGHSSNEETVKWTTRGPVSEDWHRLPPKVLINMEPCYEQIGNPAVTARDVRNASYWSLLSTPVAGITYGASGIWPWLRQAGEQAENHRAVPGVSPWHASINLPGSLQIGYLAGFLKQLPWWTFKPAQSMLSEQPGDEVAKHFVSVAISDDRSSILVYLPIGGQTMKLVNPERRRYEADWFDPENNTRHRGQGIGPAPLLEITSPLEGDALLWLRAEP
jgi:hypothetical protein